jgi:hypothetical protein
MLWFLSLITTVGAGNDYVVSSYARDIIDELVGRLVLGQLFDVR